ASAEPSVEAFRVGIRCDHEPRNPLAAKMAEKMGEQQASEASTDVFRVDPHVLEFAGRVVTRYGIETEDGPVLGRAIHGILGDKLGRDREVGFPESHQPCWVAPEPFGGVSDPR